MSWPYPATTSDNGYQGVKPWIEHQQHWSDDCGQGRGFFISPTLTKSHTCQQEHKHKHNTRLTLVSWEMSVYVWLQAVLINFECSLKNIKGCGCGYGNIFVLISVLATLRDRWQTDDSCLHRHPILCNGRLIKKMRNDWLNIWMIYWLIYKIFNLLTNALNWLYLEEIKF